MKEDEDFPVEEVPVVRSESGPVVDESIEALFGDDDEDLAERGTKRNENNENEKRSKRRVQRSDSDDDALLNLENEELVCMQSKGWPIEWMTKNPMSNRPWDIHDESVQRKVVDMLNKSKPEYLEIRTNGIDDKSKKLNDFLSMICCIQNKNGRKFVVSQPVNVPLNATGKLMQLRKLPNVIQTIRYNPVATIRYVANSEAVIGQLGRPESR